MQHRIKDIYAFMAALTLLAALFLSPTTRADGLSAQAPAQGSNAWRFRVLLDEKEIGYHDFFLAGDGEHRQLRSVARFEYRLLFVKLFDYEHENLETWSGNCLQSVRSRTDSNGDLYAVSGRRSDGAFNVVSNEGAAELPGCVMTFAYWNPDFLEQSRLLNTQDGSFLDVVVSPPVSEQLVVNGEPLRSYRYRLVAGEMKLDLWYSADKEWLALESEVAGGRTLRYEPVRKDVS
jgi:hypothetical protein